MDATSLIGILLWTKGTTEVESDTGGNNHHSEQVVYGGHIPIAESSPLPNGSPQTITTNWLSCVSLSGTVILLYTVLSQNHNACGDVVFS